MACILLWSSAVRVHEFNQTDKKIKGNTVDPLPTRIVIEYLDVLLPVMVKLINGSLQSGVVPNCFKNAVIKSLLKKPSHDPNSMKNNRPVSNFLYISKLLKHVVTEQPVIHPNKNYLLDKVQSAYRTGFNTETAFYR